MEKGFTFESDHVTSVDDIQSKGYSSRQKEEQEMKRLDNKSIIDIVMQKQQRCRETKTHPWALRHGGYTSIFHTQRLP